MIALFVGIGYNVLVWTFAVRLEGDEGSEFIGTILGAWLVLMLLLLVFLVFLVPFRLLRQTRYFRVVTTTIVTVLAAIVLSQYAFSAVSTAAQNLHDDGKFSRILDVLFGVQPQIATVQWDSDKLTPENRSVLVLGQSEDAVWLYDCSAKRTIRVAGSDIVATKLVLDPESILSCSETTDSTNGEEPR